MMTIVHFVTSETFGGVETHICTLIKLMKNTDYQFKVVCHEANETKFREALSGLDVDVVSLKNWFKPYPFGYLKLVRIFKDFKPDVVQCHLYSATRIGALAAKLAGVKNVIETIHMEEAWRRGFKKRFFNLLDAIIGRLFVNKYVAVSKALARFYSKDKWVSENKIVQIYNTIETEDVKTDLTKGFTCRVGFLGRLSEEKGVDILIEAISLLKKENIGCKLLIGGTGPLRKDLEAQAEEKNVEGSVTFLGQISDKNKFFNETDIFVLPSRSEGFSLVLLEAALYQMPVIATNVSGNPEIIRHKETGIIVEKEKPEEIVAAIKVFLSKENRERYSRNLKSFFESEFSPGIYLKKMNSFYKSLSE